jgi:hypothetical protein
MVILWLLCGCICDADVLSAGHTVMYLGITIVAYMIFEDLKAGKTPSRQTLQSTRCPSQQPSAHDAGIVHPSPDSG